MVFARLRPRSGHLDITFALGGHPRPFVVRSDARVETPGRHGTLLGVLADVQFTTTNVTLAPGESFVAVTDGVLEAYNPEQGAFADRVPHLLAEHAGGTAQEMVAAVEQAALDWQGGASRDDIAIVALRVPTQR
jgi:serine phosphatase RsbU (regulator of sigma subunit)